MPVPYCRIEDKVKYINVHCPKCLSSDYRLACRNDLVQCVSCGWVGLYDEMAFMKLRPHPQGLDIEERRGRWSKYGNDVIKKVIAHYQSTDDTIEQTAKKFGISRATAGKMIKNSRMYLNSLNVSRRKIKRESV